MRKTVELYEGKSLTLENNVGWALAYRSQFGRDIIPAIMPALGAVLQIVTQIWKDGGAVDNLGEILEGDGLTDAIVELSGLELVDFIQITWAMAKTAEPDIPEPEVWVKGFEAFPLDVIAPAVFELAARGLVSSKNWNRLRSTMENLRKSTST